MQIERDYVALNRQSAQTADGMKLVSLALVISDYVIFENIIYHTATNLEI